VRLVNVEAGCPGSVAEWWGLVGLAAPTTLNNRIRHSSYGFALPGSLKVCPSQTHKECLKQLSLGCAWGVIKNFSPPNLETDQADLEIKIAHPQKPEINHS
jgi:hypothetical protein